MTPQALREIANTLDALSTLTVALYEPIAVLDELGAESVEVTIELSRTDGKPIPPEQARGLIRWVQSTEMQDDLREWADMLEEGELPR